MRFSQLLSNCPSFMVHVYPKQAIDRRQLVTLLERWPQERYVVVEQRGSAVKLLGLQSWLGHKNTLTQKRQRPR